MGRKSDLPTTPERSYIMSKVKGKETKPEIRLRKALWSKGYRYRKNVKSINGNPDIVFRGKKIVIFIDGKFWHGYNWDIEKEKLKTNRLYWIEKIEKNIKRDRFITERLQDSGYIVLRFWDFEINKNLPKCVEIIESHLKKN